LRRTTSPVLNGGMVGFQFVRLGISSNSRPMESYLMLFDLNTDGVGHPHGNDGVAQALF